MLTGLVQCCCVSGNEESEKRRGNKGRLVEPSAHTQHLSHLLTWVGLVAFPATMVTSEITDRYNANGKLWNIGRMTKMGPKDMK